MALALAAVKKPLAQRPQVRAPGSLLKRPGVQARHWPAAVTSPRKPAAQEVQAVPPTAKVVRPGEHRVHAGEASKLEKVPRGHSVQVVALTPEVRPGGHVPHVVELALGWKRPGAQAVQLRAPISDCANPGTQSKHWLGAAMLPLRPAGQLMQVVRPTPVV